MLVVFVRTSTLPRRTRPAAGAALAVTLDEEGDQTAPGARAAVIALTRSLWEDTMNLRANATCLVAICFMSSALRLDAQEPALRGQVSRLCLGEKREVRRGQLLLPHDFDDGLCQRRHVGRIARRIGDQEPPPRYRRAAAS